MAAMVGASGTANAVHVIGGLFGQIVVNNQLNPGHIYAAGGNIGGN